MELVAADIGGTHARFSIAQIEDGRVVSLTEPCTLRTAEHGSLQIAWQAFESQAGRHLPDAAAVAVAASVHGEELRFTNNPWVIRTDALAETLNAERLVLINDFGAVGHAVAQLDERHFRHLAGPERTLPQQGVISVIGPGTGLGVAQILRIEAGYQVIETEGGHVDFAALDPLEDRILAHLRSRYGRVSVERIASGPGLANIHQVIAAIEGAPAIADEKALWTAALAGEGELAAAALERFCLSLGAIAGDTALAHGASAVVIAGGLGLRLADYLPSSGFAGRFTAKGRFERMMSEIPVKIITHPQPGLFGAAAAFATKFRD